MTNIAAIQMASGPQPQANLLEAKRLLREAAEKGAKLAVLPENFAMMGMQETDVLKIAEDPRDGPLQTFLAEQARRLGIWLVGGTIPLKTLRGDRARSTCMVFDDQGERVARYDKLHLFDVRLPDGDERYTESRIYEPGEQIVTLDTPFGRMGLAVCYDLRFPELFRGLLDQGAEFVAMPAAFTAQTGQAHWDILLRARAIENQMFMLAAAQGGFHVNGRETYGHSALIDPWGRVVAQLGRNPGVLVADLGCECVGRIRTLFPAVQHRRLACEVEVAPTSS
ncbi:carbon-nitrogen hydrolase family protein [Thioalkalivibrio paradoxus]|uniref:Apolipoprotein acyltransferase n=1 Tax=Thioalkalivibrio paradoxus ARh 1 TaxID=713585 RepID=W0DKG0_9GAMM|nr:carbon-nitrogen hydrolase family protein [Thioalkalivibrio paradoxus]AHE97375.1 apolipoprotein acyltransferase [Thioalkalivibrio paradoxus ARh 1]